MGSFANKGHIWKVFSKLELLLPNCFNCMCEVGAIKGPRGKRESQIDSEKFYWVKRLPLVNLMYNVVKLKTELEF